MDKLLKYGILNPEASKVLGIRQGDIANILAGRQRSTRGFKFEYYNEK